MHGREAVSILLPIVCKKCETYLLNCQQRLSQHPMPTWRNTNDSQFSTVCSPTIVSSPPSIDVGHDIVRSRLTAIARGHRVLAAQGWGQQLEDVQLKGRLRALYPFWCATYKSTLEREPHFHCAIHWACIRSVLFNNWRWTGFNNTLKVGLESLKHVGYLLQFISDPKSTIQRQKSDPSVSLKETGKSHLDK